MNLSKLLPLAACMSAALLLAVTRPCAPTTHVLTLTAATGTAEWPHLEG